MEPGPAWPRWKGVAEECAASCSNVVTRSQVSPGQEPSPLPPSLPFPDSGGAGSWGPLKEAAGAPRSCLLRSTLHACPLPVGAAVRVSVLRRKVVGGSSLRFAAAVSGCLDSRLSRSLSARAMQAYKGGAGFPPGAQSEADTAGFSCRMTEALPSRRGPAVPLPAMQQNLNYVYPQIFWVDSCASPTCAPPAPVASCPPPVPERRRRKQSNTRDGSRLCFLVVFLLALLALAGVGLGMFKIVQLQKDLAELREQISTGHVPSSAEKRLGLLDATAEKVIKKAAHLTGKADQKALPLEWVTTLGHAFTSSIQYRQRGLAINETGLYFVYSKVFFRGKVCSSQALDHVVFKRNPAYPTSQVLMEDKKLNYCAAGKMWARGSYLGALFNLTKSDSLYVNVSDAALVNFEESKTFFGLYKL
ncbi:tumor necrosis factor ligand superfamily member 6 [Pelodiscus sinensis]|uniref:tumor necrosis factor ligand superfamily member 6 n=1 Tax=Pelodiscus sinensis TaxID=13735 RepID=UPI003F6D2990